MKKGLAFLALLVSLIPGACDASGSGPIEADIEVGYISGGRSSYNLTFDQSVKGTISPLDHHGRIIPPYHSFYENLDVKDVRLKERISALEGSYSSEHLMTLKSNSISFGRPIINKSVGKAAYAAESYWYRPTELLSNKTLEYSGRGISDREYVGTNYDVAGTSFLYNKELSKETSVNVSLKSMEALIKATDEGIIDEERKTTRSLGYVVQAHSSGIADVKWHQAGKKYTGELPTRYETINFGDERYYGTFDISKRIRMESKFAEVKKKDAWLPCCFNGYWDMAKFDREGHSAEDFFS